MLPENVVGEPDAGNPHVRFDEGVQETCRKATRLCSTLRGSGGGNWGLWSRPRSPAEPEAIHYLRPIDSR